MVLSLVLASCAPAAIEEEEKAASVTETVEEEVVTEEEEVVAEKKPEMVKIRATKKDGTVVEKMVEKPRYGGTLTFALIDDPRGFDEVVAQPAATYTMRLTNERLVIGDWTKGLAGTGENSWAFSGPVAMEELAGSIAESWELTDPQTVVYHIRKGIHWHDKPPVNGRELTADDVVWSLNYYFSQERSYLFNTHPEGVESITAPDKWTVVFKSPPGYAGPQFESIANQTSIVPREMIEEVGPQTEWKNSCGTGPFMMVDVVPGSSITFERNPNYWYHDPLHPDNQLPYLDGSKWLIIPDMSTQLAALRTDRLDLLRSVTWEDGEAMAKSKPSLQYTMQYDDATDVLGGRMDKPELPFDDIRVRKALNMGLDRQAIVDDYYGGNACPLPWPVTPLPRFSDLFTPIDEFPPEIREIFEYNPDKAKELLAEAGYPDGFRTEVVCWTDQVDMLSIFKDYWAKIGVDLHLDVKEYGVYYSMKKARSHNEMFVIGRGCATIFKMQNHRKGLTQNITFVDDPYTEETFSLIADNYFNEAEKRRVYKEWSLYAYSQAWEVPFPLEKEYTFWQPWVKNYHGEFSIGYQCRLNFPMFTWIDQDVKEEMTGRR